MRMPAAGVPVDVSRTCVVSFPIASTWPHASLDAAAGGERAMILDARNRCPIYCSTHSIRFRYGSTASALFRDARAGAQFHARRRAAQRVAAATVAADQG